MIPVRDGAAPVTSNRLQHDPYKLGVSAVKGVRGLGISQLVMGSLCIIFEIAAVALYHSNLGLDNVMNGYTAPGIWNGAFILIIGIIGVLTARMNSRGWIIAYMVINIIAAVEMPTFITMAGIATSESRNCGDGILFLIYYSGNNVDCSTYAPLALNIMNLMMAISQFIITIVAASLCCGPACCNSRPIPMQTTTMVVHGGQQQQGFTTVVANQPYGQTSYVHTQQPYTQVMQPGMSYTVQQQPVVYQQQQQQQPGVYQQPPPNYYGQPQQPVSYVPQPTQKV